MRKTIKKAIRSKCGLLFLLPFMYNALARNTKRKENTNDQKTTFKYGARK